MLKRLHISNYALIDTLDVSFPGKLTVITGETGAGKSIFLEAMGVALGNRADISVLKNKNNKCIVEAEFDISAHDLKPFFTENELDYEASAILRREINSEGKSRAFINDSPVNLSLLKQLSGYLIDVHSQHQTLLLSEVKFQLQLIDAFAETTDDFAGYKKDYFYLGVLKKQLADLEEKEKQAKKDLDYFQFLFDELQEFELNSNQLKELESEANTLENAEQIKSVLSATAQIINGSEVNALTMLASAKQKIQGITRFNVSYASLLERVQAVFIELKDINEELESEESKLLFEPNRLSLINENLDKINRLFKKHSVKSIDELLIIKTEIEEKLNQFNSLEKEIATCKKTIAALKQSCVKQAKLISDKRSKVSPSIETNINALLAELAMPNARFKIAIEKTEELSINGQDEVSFLFTANKGGDFKELHKVASGGEMSRLMLSLKSVLAEKMALPTIIFDEIDTGISGDIAHKMGNIFNKMAKNMQVISITHLPQIASKGQHHLFVYKSDDKKQTSSFIKTLENGDRIIEIAKMLSTENPTESAIKNAKDLLKTA